MLSWLVTVARWFAEQQPTPETPQPPREPGEEGEGETKPFIEHLEDLRRTLFKIAVALFIGFNVCLAFADRILVFLKAPLCQIVPNCDDLLIVTEVSGPFVLWMKLAFYGGVLLASPFIIYFIADFILPALRRKERELVIPAFVFGTLMFVAGAASCYYWMIPQTLKVFLKYSEWLKIKPLWTITSYVGFVTNFMLSVGITFEVPLVVLMLVRLGILRGETVARGRKVMIATAVILAAILAPPDPLSMILMAIPLVVIGEATIWLAKFVQYRRDKHVQREDNRRRVELEERYRREEEEARKAHDEQNRPPSDEGHS